MYAATGSDDDCSHLVWCGIRVPHVSVMHVLSYLGARSLAAASRSCSSLRAAAAHDELWGALTLKRQGARAICQQALLTGHGAKKRLVRVAIVELQCIQLLEVRIASLLL